jgi:hypothetical protein
VGRLEVVGAVARIHGPPLEALPGWRLRAPQLAEIGIVTAEEFLEADGALIDAHIERRSGTADKWKKDVRKWLTPPPPGRRRG